MSQEGKGVLMGGTGHSGQGNPAFTASIMFIIQETKVKVSAGARRVSFGFVGRAVSYPKHDREIRLFTSICRDSPAYQGQTIIFTLPPLCSITLWRVYINHRNINYLFPPDFRGR